jgi:hypothetical protein
MLVKAYGGGGNAIMSQEFAGAPGIFGRDVIHFLQDSERPQGDIF